MEQKKIKKLALKKETISNLSKFEQGGIIGGYDPGEAIYEKTWYELTCLKSLVLVGNCPEVSGDTCIVHCDSTVDYEKTCYADWSCVHDNC
jgi:hypothetical protein